MLPEKDSDGQPVFRPVLEFKNERGETVQRTYHKTSSMWKKGEIISLVSGTHGEIIAVSYSDLYAMPAILLGAGLALFVEMLFYFFAT